MWGGSKQQAPKSGKIHKDLDVRRHRRADLKPRVHSSALHWLDAEATVSMQKRDVLLCAGFKEQCDRQDRKKHIS